MCSTSRIRLAAALVVLAAAPALAQDYVVSSVSSQYVTPPSSGTTNLVSSTKSRDNNAFAITNLPFSVFYFGQYYSSFQVCTNGFVQFGGGTSVATTPVAFPLSSGNDGICAAAWDDLDGQGASSALVVFTDGTAPNRRIIVDWSAWEQAQNTGSLAFQIQFYETSGRIQFAYASGWSGQTRAKAAGIDAVGADTRYVTPDGSTLYYNSPTSQPANDWRFDPRITTFSGRVLFDRIVVDGTGIGNVSPVSTPLAGLRVEARDGSGTAVASGTTDASGNYSFDGKALVGTASGSLAVLSQGATVAVRASTGGQPYAFTFANGVSFGSNQALGTVSLTNSNDPGGTGRAPLHVAYAAQSVATWSAARTTDSIPAIEVLYDTASALGTSYTPASGTAATMRVGAAASNPDGWDGAVIRKTFARHVLAAIAASPTTAIDTTFDKVTDDENAFAEAFGYYVNAAITGDANWFDGLSSSSSTQIALESPTLVASKGSSVAGWVAAALYDLVDGANESWDTFDGAGGASDKVFQTVDSLTQPATADRFYTAWGALGFAGDALARDFIRHGLIGDDADEPNDAVAERHSLPSWGFARTGRVLNLYNEDWYEVTVPAATNAMTVDVVYDRSAISAVVSLEVQNAGGSVIGTGSYLPLGGPLRASLGARPPGTYRVRVKHESGARVAPYTLQCFSELTLSAGTFKTWTVGRPYEVAVEFKGGVAPYTLTVESPFVKPAGLILDSANARVGGAPTEAGTFDFSLTTRDAATPNNLASLPVHLVVNPALEFTLGEFLAMPLGKSLDRRGAYTGGTAPLTFETTSGGLPDGVAFAPGEFRFVGTPTAAGSTPFALQGTDVAGSQASGQSTGVVCVPFGAAGLAAGASACGFWFDAIQGTTVSISVKTAKKQPKRPLRMVIVGPDGNTSLPAAPKNGTGKTSLSGFVTPASGRFYCVVASDAGDATQLTGALKLKAAKKGAGDSGPDLVEPGTDVPVEFGAFAGTTLSFTVKTEKGSAMQLRLPYLVTPDGTAIALATADVTQATGSITFARTLDTAGTWTVVLGAKPGPGGRFSWKYGLKAPKGATYAAE